MGFAMISIGVAVVLLALRSARSQAKKVPLLSLLTNRLSILDSLPEELGLLSPTIMLVLGSLWRHARWKGVDESMEERVRFEAAIEQAISEERSQTELRAQREMEKQREVYERQIEEARTEFSLVKERCDAACDELEAERLRTAAEEMRADELAKQIVEKTGKIEEITREKEIADRAAEEAMVREAEAKNALRSTGGILKQVIAKLLVMRREEDWSRDHVGLQKLFGKIMWAVNHQGALGFGESLVSQSILGLGFSHL